MAKFVVVSKAPEKLEKGEVVIAQPDFMEQIQANSQKAGSKKLTAVNHLREVINSIGMKYDPDLNVFRMNFANYQGLPYSNNDDLSVIVTRILRNEYPAVFDRYLEFQLRNRPMNTKLIYYVGNFSSTAPFYQAGLDLLEEKDLAAYLTGKPKKVVGKPAITAEEADADNE